MFNDESPVLALIALLALFVAVPFILSLGLG